MLVLGMFRQIIKSLFRKYTISLHPLYHPFSCYIKEISHLRKMADVVSSETQYGNGHHVAACQYQRRDNHQRTKCGKYLFHCASSHVIIVGQNICSFFERYGSSISPVCALITNVLNVYFLLKPFSRLYAHSSISHLGSSI